jgi:hypothetical protein
LETLMSVAPPACRGLPRVVLLTPGAFNSAYYEHCFLADEMGDRGRVANFADVIDGIAYSKPDEDPEPDETPAHAAEAQTLPAEDQPAASVPIPLRGDRTVNPASAPLVTMAEPSMHADYRALLGDFATPFEVSGTVGHEGERYLFLDSQGQVWVGADEAAVRQAAKDMAKAR